MTRYNWWGLCHCPCLPVRGQAQGFVFNLSLLSAGGLGSLKLFRPGKVRYVKEDSEV